MLDFRMETFLTVCDTMNFTRAAEILSLTQPAVSQHIKFLEEQYQTKLFEYRGKKLALTAAGVVLRDAARTMRQDNAYLMKKLHHMNSAPRKLCFGATLTVAEFALPGPLAHYIYAHADQSIRMVSDNTQELLADLDKGAIDFAIVEGNFPREDYSWLLYSRERYVAVCAARFPLPQEPCSLEELLPQRLIMREPGSGTRNILEKYLDAKSLSVNHFRFRAEIGNMGTIKKLVALGCGITFLYERAVKEELRQGVLREIPIRDFGITHDFNFIWRKNSIFADEYLEVFYELKREKES